MSAGASDFTASGNASGNANAAASSEAQAQAQSFSSALQLLYQDLTSTTAASTSTTAGTPNAFDSHSHSYSSSSSLSREANNLRAQAFLKHHEDKLCAARKMLLLAQVQEEQNRQQQQQQQQTTSCTSLSNSEKHPLLRALTALEAAKAAHAQTSIFLQALLHSSPSSRITPATAATTSTKQNIPDSFQEQGQQRDSRKIGATVVTYDAAAAADIHSQSSTSVLKQSGQTQQRNKDDEYNEKQDVQSQSQSQSLSLPDGSEDTDDNDDDGYDDHLSDKQYFDAFAAASDEDNNRLLQESFPLKLYRMLFEVEQAGQDNIISFLPHGKAFFIHRPKDFVEQIMPRYFTTCRLASFQRQLNLYSFRRITKGTEKGSYAHDLFNRGKRSLCRMIKRQKLRGKTLLPTISIVTTASAHDNNDGSATFSNRQSPNLTADDMVSRGTNTIASPISNNANMATSLPSGERFTEASHQRDILLGLLAGSLGGGGQLVLAGGQSAPPDDSGVLQLNQVLREGLCADVNNNNFARGNALPSSIPQYLLSKLEEQEQERIMLLQRHRLLLQQQQQQSQKVIERPKQKADKG